MVKHFHAGRGVNTTTFVISELASRLEMRRAESFFVNENWLQQQNTLNLVKGGGGKPSVVERERADGLVASWIARQSDSWRPQAEILFRAHKERAVKANAPAPIASAPGDVGKKRACPGSLVFEEPDAGALPTSVPKLANSVSTPLIALLELSRSRIRQLITLEGMPTDPDEAKLWYDANAKKNPSYKRGPAKHEEMLLAAAYVEGGSSVVGVSSSSVNTGILQHELGGISAVRVHQLKDLGMPTHSLDAAVLWRRNRITQSNHTAGAHTKIPAQEQQA